MNAFRDALDDLASGVRVVDMAPRVAAGSRRRRRNRIVVMSAVAASVLAVAALGVSALRHDTRAVLPATQLVRPAATGGVDVVWWSVHDGAFHLYGQRLDATTSSEIGTYPGGPYDVSGDGTRIAYLDQARIAVLTIPDGTVQRFDVHPAAGVQLGRPVWSPDRFLVACAEGRQTAKGFEWFGYLLLDVHDGMTTRFAHPNTGTLSWSPADGTLAIGRPGYTGVDLVRLDGTRRGAVLGPRWGLRSPHSWSPGGSLLLVDVAPAAGKGNNGSSTLVVSVRDGKVVATLPWALYDWRDEGHVLSVVDRRVTERTLDAAVVGETRLDVTTKDMGDPVIRPSY